MVEIIIGETVINRLGVVGTITAFDGRYISVDYQDRVARLESDALEKRYIRYADTELQNKVEEAIALEAGRRAEESRLAEEKKLKEQTHRPSQTTVSRWDVTDGSEILLIDTAPVNLNSVSTKDRALVKEIFEECEKDTRALYENFKPKMVYPKYTSQSRSKYCVGFLTKYLDSYVFRVFSRNDVYKKRVRSGVTVFESNTAEILRVIQVNGKLYYFSKNIAFSQGYYNNSTAYNNWHSSEMGTNVFLNEVICNCDCGYLNGHITDKRINKEAFMFIDLLFLAFVNNKAEIVFKNKAFTSAHGIDNFIFYLESFTPKQIDFASKNDVLHALPFIKRFGVSDIGLLLKLEAVMKKRGYRESVRDKLKSAFSRLGADDSDLDRRLMNFLKNTENFNAGVYYDYLYELAFHPAAVLTVQDLFDENYYERHDELLRQRTAHLNIEEVRYYNQEYRKVAKELSWIDREENGYFITVPKTLAEFEVEGAVQHNCVYKCGYYRFVVDRKSIIVFLRKEKDTPYVTIEYDYETFAVQQALGKYNRIIDVELYQYVIQLGKQLYYEKHSYQ